MEIGLGVMHIPASEFWGMSLQEFYSACDGLNEYNSGSESRPLTRNELEELMELYPD